VAAGWSSTCRREPPPHAAGREAGGRPLPFTTRWRAAATAAPAWYAGTVLAPATFAAAALIGRPAGAGLAVVGAALCAAAAVQAG